MRIERRSDEDASSLPRSTSTPNPLGRGTYKPQDMVAAQELVANRRVDFIHHSGPLACCRNPQVIHRVVPSRRVPSVATRDLRIWRGSPVIIVPGGGGEPRAPPDDGRPPRCAAGSPRYRPRVIPRPIDRRVPRSLAEREGRSPPCPLPVTSVRPSPRRSRSCPQRGGGGRAGRATGGRARMLAPTAGSGPAVTSDPLARHPTDRNATVVIACTRASARDIGTHRGSTRGWHEPLALARPHGDAACSSSQARGKARVRRDVNGTTPAPEDPT